MNLYLSLGRIFPGICLTGIGLCDLFFQGINPIIWPGILHSFPPLHWTVIVSSALLIFSGGLIVAGKWTSVVALILGSAFFLLFLFGHLPAFLSAVRMDKLKYWTNLNKMLALSGGFFILTASSLKANNTHLALARVAGITGRFFFGCMLFLFGLGHFLSLAAVSTLVPDYIPFKQFWTLTGGMLLILSAISIFFNFRMQRMSFILAAVLMLWFLTLHLYYCILYVRWQDGENIIGALTCLAFCGTALLLSQTSRRATLTGSAVAD